MTRHQAGQRLARLTRRIGHPHEQADRRTTVLEHELSAYRTDHDLADLEALIEGDPGQDAECMRRILAGRHQHDLQAHQDLRIHGPFAAAG